MTLLKLLSLLPMLLLLASCSTAAPKAEHSVGVPLPPWSAADQKAAAAKIVAACGKPPHCPAGAVLEQAALDYVKLRDEVRAAGGE